MSIKSRRIIALLLCLVMVITSMPMSALAMDVDNIVVTTTEQEAALDAVSPEDITADINEETTTEDNPTADEDDPAVEEEETPAVEEEQTPVIEEETPAVEEEQTPVIEEETPAVEEEQTPVIEEETLADEEVPVLGGALIEEYQTMLLDAVIQLEEEDVPAVTVHLTAQANGEFLLAPQIEVEITGDVAENYGYKDQVADGVSLLDALVWAHTQYIEDFTVDTAADYLVVEDNYISKVWGWANSRIGFMVNGAQPHDDNLSAGGYYGGYGIGQAAVVDGDNIEFFLYQDEAYGDDYVWLETADGAKADGIVVDAGAVVNVYAKGYSPFEYGIQKDEVIAANTKAISGAALYLVDAEDGTLTALGVTTDAEGCAAVAVPDTWAGTYYLAAKGTNVIMNLAAVTVNEFVDNGASALTSLEIAVGGNTVDAAVTQEISPEFDKETLDYSTPILDYQSDKNQRFVWVKVTADENATVTAQCGKSNVATVKSGEWTVLQVQGGYFYAPTYSGPLNTGAYNDVVITVEADGALDKTYTVTVPMQPDTANQSLAWKTDLADAVYYTKGAEAASLTVEAEHKNRPLDNEDVITYQWYSNTTASNEGGTAIAGATSASYSPATAELGTAYYYVVASCGDLASLTSKVVTVKVTDEAAPESVSIVCDYPYTLPDSWASLLGGKKYVAKVGETLQLKAVDENGEETPVEWITGNMYGGTLDKETGVYTITGTSYSYIQAASLYDPSIKSEEKVIEVVDYSISNKTPSVTLANDGQASKKIEGYSSIGNGYAIWNYTSSADNIAELLSDLATKPTRIEFAALRPGTIGVSFDLDLNGDGEPDGNGLTDSATLTINGIAVEDADGKLGKTYLEMGVTAPSVQLTALSSTENAKFTWSSADDTVATVDENGLVTAKGIGSVIISANDGTYTGGIKVVVTSAATPYFEQLDFTTTSAWGNGLSNATWKTANFKPTTLEYTGLQMTKADAGTLTLNASTLFNTDKYSAVATYTDANGEAKSVDIKSGAATELKDLPFETITVTITLADKTDETKKTAYTFEVTRPRDTIKAIANSGIVFNPEGREVWKDKYNEKTEGIMYVANEGGSFAQYQGVSSSRPYYRTYAMNALDAFTLTVKGNSVYTHIRYSVDDGATWTYLGQTGTGGVKTNAITFPAAAEDANPVAKVIIQILDDMTYTANIKAEKDGFADSTPKAYTLWVEQIPVLSAACDIVTAEISHGDWYPEFDVNRTDYRLVVDKGDAAPVLTYTISDKAVAKIGNVVQTPDENGKYTLPLTVSSQNIVIAAGDGMSSKTYSFGYNEKESDKVPDKVVDFLSVNSQYTNGSGGGYGVSPQKTLTGGDVLSLGNFGGYITYYYDAPLTNDPANRYGIDFYVDGNAFKDTSTGTGLGSMEPGQVWVSEDGEEWYALAGSEHYEDGTLWDYAVTYSKTETGGTVWVDNQGNTHESTHGRAFAWPQADVYTMNDLPAQDSFTLSGILIPCVDGSITGADKFNSFSGGARFGYADVLVNGRANPYLTNDKYENESTGFDLAWAVDENGMPVGVSDMEFHYVKVVTASNIIAGSANEKSTEVGAVIRADGQSEAVGVTDAPAGVTISGNGQDKEVKFTDGKQVYAVDLGDMKYVSIKVNGAAADDNIYVNNQRIAADEAAEGFKVTSADGEKPVRIIVQNGDKEPLIYMLKLSSNASAGEELIDGIKVDIYGVDRVADTKDGETYTLSVGHRINEVGIEPIVSAGTDLTVNGKAMADVYALKTGDNTFTVTAQKGNITQTVTLVITKDSAPVATGTIKVYFTLLGDDLHGDPTGESDTHTLKDNNLDTWIKKASYTVDDTATVLDVLVLALDEAGLDYVNEGGNYVSEIEGLAEFDNGPYSGWMYTLNGKHPKYGVMEQELKNGDAIVFHYSDDYTVEEGSEGYEPFNPSGGSVTVTAEDRAAAKDVNNLIAAIGTVDENSKDAITAAREAYEKLTDTQKELVSEYDKLVAAEKAYAELTGEDIAPADMPYTDTEGHWATDAIKFAYEKGLMKGESETSFAPNKTASRAMIATILYRLEDSPAVDGKASFGDVVDGAWYMDAVCWAEANKIVGGYADGNFGPNDSITREQLASILYRYAAHKGENMNATADLSNFADANGISEWSYTALAWANAEGLITGKTGNIIDAKGKATRAEIATILMRYIEGAE